MTEPTRIHANKPAPLRAHFGKKGGWSRRLVWLVPIGALIAAGFYARDYLAIHGPKIIVTFANVDGVKAGETPVEYRGVQIGQVSDIRLSPNRRSAMLEINLDRDKKSFAEEGASFWIVSPEASAAGVTGLSTVFSGPYIGAAPGNGAALKEFAGLAESPLEGGLNLLLRAPRLEHVTERSPVTYRGVQVGVVRNMELARDADHVDISLVIWRRYRALIRQHSRFWVLSGFNVEGGLLSGVELKLESLRTLISGGIAFATPDTKDMGGPVKDGAQFVIDEKPDKDWDKWAPKIPVSPSPPKIEPPIGTEAQARSG